MYPWFRLLLCFVLVTSMATISVEAKTEMKTSISQYGITWTFDKPVKAGQFITGDWWVVGPVRVVSVSPKPGPVDKDSYKAKANRWGDKVLKADPRMRNGSMIIEKRTSKVGYDSRVPSFDPKLALSFPLTLKVNQSLISTASHDMPGGQNLAHPIMWPSEKKNKNALKTGAVLTCLAKQPPADAFRPPLSGTKKTIFREKDIQWDKLMNLEPTKSMPPWSQLARYFERPWLDHHGSWTLQVIGPSENNAIYGREITRLTSLVALALNTKGTQAQKRKTLIGLIQYGIDVQGFINSGGNWLADGGHHSGRKLPLLFAGIMLGDKEMANPGPAIHFQEDQDTYYAKTYFGAPVSFQMTTHHGPKAAYEHKDPSKWDNYDKRSESYRVCCNGKAWVGTALAIRVMGQVKTWNHDAFFDYCDRWMQKDDPYAKARGKRGRPKQEGSAYDGFVNEMWAKYRSSTEQEFAGHSRRWMWTMQGGKPKGPGYWEDNPRPKDM